MKHIKTILTSSKEIFITYILSYVIIIIACLIYTLLGHDNLDNFISTTCSYFLLLFYILITIYLYKKNYRQEPALSFKNYFPLIILGISLATFLNMIIFILFPPLNNTTISPLLSIISSGLIGPIYEEILFRYLLYNRLKKNYSVKKAILITTSLFALIHLSLVKIIYAFILGLVLNIMYEKYNNILSPILIHIAANTIVIFLSEYNTYILLLSIINLILSILIYQKFKNHLV